MKNTPIHLAALKMLPQFDTTWDDNTKITWLTAYLEIIKLATKETK